MTITIDLPRQIDAGLASEIVKESAYVSPFLAQLEVGPELDRVALEVSDPGQAAQVREKVDRFLEAMLKKVHSFETRSFVKTARKDTGPYATDVHRGLVERGWLYDYNRGRAALSGPALMLAKWIDATAARLYHQAFDAEERDFPALIDADLLWRCGYFDSHPNNVCFVGHVVEDFDSIEQFRVANSGVEAAVMPPREHVSLPGMCLNPAACFPCYPTMSGQTLPEGGRIMTWKGRVFRFESRNVAGLDRMWEFNVREIVFAGTDEFVVSARRRVLPIVEELAQLLDVECEVETANDPFFATVAAARSFWQRAQEVKNEIMLPIGERPDGSLRRLACGSVNLHGSFFGDRFGFAAGNGSASTGCVGLGVERWVMAAFSQHGFDPQRWPDAVRTEIFN